jgi:ABC-type dipeptide/oligopeptide/nickel transport system permease subunit
MKASLPITASSKIRVRTFWSDAISRFVRNKLAGLGFFGVVVLILVAIFAPWIAKEPYDVAHFEDAWQFPSREHWMGTDNIGRDLFGRVVYGARVSLLVGFGSQLITVLVGIPLGMLAGMRGPLVDALIMRTADVLWAFPRLLFALLMMAAIGAGISNVVIVLAITGWIPAFRLGRGMTRAHRERDYVLAARAIGVPDIRLMLRHLLPNIMPELIVAIMLGIPEAIFTESGLSFLGIGIKPPTPSWGQMVGYGVANIQYYWHLAFFPALMVGITMFSFTLFGDGLRDALDPYMTR